MHLLHLRGETVKSLSGRRSHKSELVIAARVSGEHTWRIIFCEIFPNEIGLVVAGFVSTTIYVVLTWAALEFLGLGDGTIPSWGSMLYWAQQAGALGGGLWWSFVPPSACIAILGAGLSLINFGIDEIADPRLRVERLVKAGQGEKAANIHVTEPGDGRWTHGFVYG